MADLKKRLKSNMSGNFFVDSTCINCDTCRQLAPETFEEVGVTLPTLKYLGKYHHEKQYKKDTVYCFFSEVASFEYIIDNDEIEEAVKKAIETLGPRGFILNASIYFYDDDVTWDRFIVFVNAWRKYAN